MAKQENWSKIRSNIIVTKYDKYQVDQRILEKIATLERELYALKIQAQRVTEVYVPERHPLFEKLLIREGKLITLANCRSNGVRIDEESTLQYVRHINDMNDITNILLDETLSKLNYKGERYKRLTLVFDRDKEILRLSGVTEDNLI